MRDAYIVRLSPEEFERVSRHMVRLADSTKTNVSRSSALRALILRGLESVEREKKR